ncbi:MAG: TolC family protein [bacterium]|nr:MAG: TolC family protein [bacterium]
MIDYIRPLLLILLLCHALPVSAVAGEGVLSPREAYLLALVNNEDIRVAAEDLKQGRLVRKQAYSVLLPTLTATAGYSKLYFSDDLEVENRAYGVSLNQMIYHGGRAFIALKGAEMTIAAAEHGLAFARWSVLMDLLVRTYSALSSEDLLRLEDERIERVSEQLRSASTKFEIGEAAKTDVLAAKVAVATARKDRVEAQKNLVLARRSLGDLIGMGGPIRVTMPPDVPVPEAELEELTRIALEERRDLLQGRELVRVVEQEAKEAASRNRPEVDLSASHTEYSDESPFAPESQVSLDITFPLFQGGLVKYQSQEARSRVLQAELVLQKRIKEVAFGVEEAFREYGSLVAQKELIETSLENARENYRLERIRFELGDATNLDVLVAQGGLSSAENQAVLHRYRTRLAKAALLFSIGRMTPDALGIAVDEEVLEK